MTERNDTSFDIMDFMKMQNRCYSYLTTEFDTKNHESQLGDKVSCKTRFPSMTGNGRALTVCTVGVQNLVLCSVEKNNYPMREAEFLDNDAFER